MPTQISASDEIFIQNTPLQVWKTLLEVSQYPLWWPPNISLRVLVKTDTLVGSVVEIRPRGGKAFRCRFVKVIEPSRIEMEYEGFVKGMGQWVLMPERGGTHITYKMNVEAKGLIVGILARFIDLGAIHSKMMRGVFTGLENVLSTK